MSNCLLADIGGTRARFALSGSRVESLDALDASDGLFSNRSFSVAVHISRQSHHTVFYDDANVGRIDAGFEFKLVQNVLT